MIGKRLNQYEILGQVGRGGMGEVYLARDVRLDRNVAVKILPAGMATDPQRRARFEREAKAIAALSHPHILAIHDFGEADGIPYAVMELLEGETLRARLEGGALPWRKAAEFGAAMAEGLAAAHARDIVHRDLKPENVFITREGLLKILDFGLARLADSPDPGNTNTPTRSVLTGPGIAAGTAGYMAPEQAKGASVDARADLFALGCVLFEMVAGRPAFTGATAAERVAAILRDSPTAPRPKEGPVPADLENVVLRCLEKDPASRFQTARDLAFTLKTIASSSDPQMAAEREPDRARVRSLVVLPLRNLSGDPEQDFFADGMTEALIADLACCGEVRVISRTSAMQYKGTNKRLQEIASELNVEAIVEGSVLRGADRVRVTVELVQVATDTTLWAQSYERGMDDILTLQGELARAITKEITGRLSAQTKARLAASKRVAPEAYEAYLKGRYYWNRRTEETIRKSIEYFNQAIDIEPAYALAHAGLADAYNILGFYGYLRPADAFPRAKASAMRALEMDPSLTDAHSLVGYVQLYYDWEWSEAEKNLRKTLEGNPNSSEGHRYLANFLTAAGRVPEAVEAIQKACQLDPLSLINSAATGWVLFYAHDYERACAELRRTQEFDRTFALGRLYCAWSLMELDRLGEALSELEKASTHGGRVHLTEAFVAYAHARSGDAARAREVLAGLEARSKQTYVPAYLSALVLVALGETDAAFDKLLVALEERSLWLVFLDRDPRMDPIRSDPRFEEIRHRVGLDRLGR